MIFCEYLVIELLLDNDISIITISIYRPPNTDLNKFNTNLLNLLEKLNEFDKKKQKKIFLAGDLNIDLLKHEQHPTTDDFLNTLMSFGYLPTISRPTRVTDYSSTLIDNIFTNSSESVSSAHIVYSDISDHLPITVNLNFNQVKPEDKDSASKRCFSTENFSIFQQMLRKTNWQFFLIIVQGLQMQI